MKMKKVIVYLYCELCGKKEKQVLSGGEFSSTAFICKKCKGAQK